jgi:hypothetical protein
VAYSATVKAKFGTKPYTWSIGSGALPTGFNVINASTGAISGTSVVNGTYSFVVHIVDSAGTPTVDNQGLYIVISGSAPAPTPSVSITTNSMPSGVVGSAYSTTLQATGGTAPYSWTIPGGALPPGISMPTTGIASGTPTASGIYSFTVRVTDSSATAQTFDRALAATIAAGGTYLFSDGFESGNFSAWTGLGSGNGTYPPTVQSTIKRSGTYAYQQQYFICGDSTNPACGANSQDFNRYAVEVIIPTQTHFFTRGYLRVKTPTSPDTSITQRKLIWISDSGAGGGGTYSLVLNSWTNTPTVLHLSILGQGATCYGSQAVVYDLANLSFDTWYSLELEVQLNTPSASPPYNGIVRLWVDGVQVYSTTTFKVNGNCPAPVQYFSYGRQTNRYNYMAVDELRYWDDIVIDDAYIGP